MLLTPDAVETLIAARADVDEVQIVDIVRGVEFLMFGLVVTVAEGNDVGERVIVVDYEGEVAHRFLAGVCRYVESTIRVGFLSVDIWVLRPARFDVLHPPDLVL